MSILSLNFLVFFSFVLLVYYLLPGRLQWIWLLISGLFFYSREVDIKQGLTFLVFLLINWLGSLFFTEGKKHRKLIFTSVLILDILFLCIMKYGLFFYDCLQKVASLFRPGIEFPGFMHFLYLSSKFAPTRISYFLLIVVAYILDVYWGKVEVEKNPAKFVLFASYLPQMTSGPIVRFDEMNTQLWGEKHRFSYDVVARGVVRVLWGVFKKLVIAERCAVIVNTIYSEYYIYRGLYVPFAAAMFALQLYTDFSGLMDIVLGISQMLGIKLPENFETPFYSTNLSEFWRRWHITLGGFLRDYVLYSVQMSPVFKKLRKFCKKHWGKGYEKKFNLPLYLSLFISWFLIGLWHGGGWNYIFGVGLYMWMVIVLSDILSPVFAFLVKILHINTECFSYKLFQRIRTIFLFIFGLSFFRADSLTDGFRMWKNALSLWNPWIFVDQSVYALGLDRLEFGILLFSLLLLLLVSVMSQKGSVREWLFAQNYVFRVVILCILLVMVVCWGYYGASFNAADFIYSKF